MIVIARVCRLFVVSLIIVLGSLLPGGPAYAGQLVMPAGENMWLTGFPAANGKLLGDVNGDGRADAISANDSSSQGAWYAALSSGSGFLPPSKLVNKVGSPNISSGDKLLIEDVDGNGTADPIRVVNGKWYICGSKIIQATGPECVVTTYSGFGTQNTTVYYKNFVADMDGDGRPDLVNCSGNQVKVAFRSVSGTYSVASNWSALSGPESSEPQAHMLGDVNGDGRPDLVSRTYSAWWAALNTGSGLSGFSRWNNSFGKPVLDEYLVGDVKLARIDANNTYDAVAVENGKWWVALSNGTSFGTPTRWAKGFSSSTAATWWNNSNYYLADVDNAGSFHQADAVRVGSTWQVAIAPPVLDQIRGPESDWTRRGDEFGTTSGPDVDPSTGLNAKLWNTHRYDYWYTGAPKGSPVLTPYNSAEQSPPPLVPTSYTSDYTPTNNNVSGGRLIQSLTRQPGTNRYAVPSINTLGQIDSGGNYASGTGLRFKGGYVEASIEVPGCYGCWPAFWMAPAVPDGTLWPNPVSGYCGYPAEIDIFEFFPQFNDQRAYFNTHWGSYNCITRPNPCPNCHDLWSDYPALLKRVLDTKLAWSSHTYGMLWVEGPSPYIQFFVDDVPGPKITSGVPQESMYLILTMQHAAGYSTETGDATKMFVDYIRVYQ